MRTRGDPMVRAARRLGNVQVIQVSERVPGERARIVAQGRSSNDGSTATLVIIHEENGSWSIHGLGVAGVTLRNADMIAVVESILARAR